jgi:hypothetical protein
MSTGSASSVKALTNWLVTLTAKSWVCMRSGLMWKSMPFGLMLPVRIACWIESRKKPRCTMVSMIDSPKGM